MGEKVTTWGFPLGYNGPAPLLSVGYLAGFMSHQAGFTPKKHLVVNGAFNSGNSGGALFRASDNKVIGIVVSKHAPISPFHQQAIDVLAQNQSGVCFQRNLNGITENIVESQIVADLLVHFRSLTQVMIGEAIAVEELKAMINEKGITRTTEEHKTIIDDFPNSRPNNNIKRNEPCSCGSGKKYKECCGKII